MKQARYASSPEFERGLIANLVAQRCRVLEQSDDRQLIWFIQLLSHAAGGLKAVAAELLEKYASRIGTASMRRFGKRPGQHYSVEQVRAIRAELPLSEREAFLLGGEEMDSDVMSKVLGERGERMVAQQALARMAGCSPKVDTWPTSYPVEAFASLCRVQAERLEEELKKLCLDPAILIEPGAPWWFSELIPCLREYCAARIAERRSQTVVTELGQQIYDELDYALETKCLVLIEGLARMGKTYAAKAWCAQRPGRARYVQVPSTNDEVGFFRAIAKALGISSGLGWKAVQLRERIEDVLQGGDLILVFDEAHYCWPTNDYRYALPGRINWIMGALVNQGVPVALITTPQFIKTQKIVEARTQWTSEQFIGRVGHFQKLPQSLSEDDLKNVALSLLPGADAKSIEILVRYAQGSAKYLAGIESAVRRACYLAAREQRQAVNRADIKRAIQESVIPSDNALAQALAEPEKRPRRRVDFVSVKEPLTADFSDRAPERISGGIRANSPRIGREAAVVTA